MPQFGRRSIDRLHTCHKDLQDIMHEAIQFVDFTVICGFRGEKAQNEAFKLGNSKAVWGESKHNASPSRAIDIAPWVDNGVNWNNKEDFNFLATIVLDVAARQGIPIKWGGHFNGFYDGAHWELV